MYYYKFRVYYDEVEDFVRDIEILSNDSFESFHKILLSSIGLAAGELASFYICDSKWNKQKEITLMDMSDDSEKEEPQYEESDEFALRSHLPLSVMTDSILKDFISDPHQHLMYEYDYNSPKVFYIELLKILESEAGVTYPRCTRKEKELPKPTKQNRLPDPDDDFLLNEDDDEDSTFDDGFNDDDFSDLNEISINDF